MRQSFVTIVLVSVLAGQGVKVAHAQQASVAQPAPAAADPRKLTAAEQADSAAIAMLVQAASNPVMQFPKLTDIADELRRVYASAAWQPRWITAAVTGEKTTMVASRAAGELLTAINLLPSRGLDPSHYDAGRLPPLMQVLETPEARAQMDVAFTVNALRIARALHEGRLRPSDAHAELRIPRPKYDAVPAVLAMADSGQVIQRLDAEEPPFVHYQLLKKSLAQYRALVYDTALLTLPPIQRGRIIKPGDSYVGINALRRLLTVVGDLPRPGYGPNPDSTLLLGDVLEGLYQFQRRSGLETDGNLGPMTLKALTRPFDARVRTIELSLERWRWLPRSYGAPPILVNLPAFRLYAFTSDSDDERDLLSMDVAIGQSFDKKTPIFSDTLRTVVFAPYWDVPPNIARAEILPKARKDLTYLERNRYEIVQGDADASPILPSSQKSLDAVQKGVARIRQLPGPTNSLGRVKFLFPNAFNIYFHDTPSRRAFERARRDVSHGCIRLSDPTALAEFLLKDQPDWTRERMDSSMTAKTPLRVRVKVARPVFILYSTAMATQDGETHFYPDIYGYDSELTARIAKLYPYAH